MTALVYLSGPIGGQTYEGATGWREWVRARLLPGINAVDPMRGKEKLRDLYGNTAIPVHDIGEVLGYDSRAITQRDRYDTTHADVMLLNLLPAASFKPSIGSMIELGWADAARVPIVMVAEQVRGAWYDHVLVAGTIGWWVDDLKTGVEIVNGLLKPWLVDFRSRDQQAMYEIGQGR